MGDRELLEMAAKAAGIKYDADSEVWVGDGIRFDWNPLIDDGDAFRLMTKLNLNIRHGDEMVLASVWDGVHADAIYYDRSPDKADAVRRAIVRAAAEIGKVMETVSVSQSSSKTNEQDGVIAPHKE